jgi:hypothetical protein
MHTRHVRTPGADCRASVGKPVYEVAGTAARLHDAHRVFYRFMAEHTRNSRFLAEHLKATAVVLRVAHRISLRLLM